jgi:hypothetical protein
MATSSTFTFRLDIEEMVSEAYERCGKNPHSLTAHDAVTARRSLNLMFSEWSVRGINYWTLIETTLDMVQGTSSYALPAGTLDVFSAVLRRSSVDTVMRRAALTDYHELPNKSSQGRPTLFFLDRQYTPVMYVWSTPENSTDDIVYWRMAQIEDVTLSQQDADVPYRWTEALVAGLAAKLAMKSAPDRLQILAQEADRQFSFAAGDEREKASLIIVPR